MFTNLKNSRYMQYISAIAATLSMASAATWSVWPSPSLPILQSDDSPLGRDIDDNEGSWVVSLYKIATVPAALLAAWLVEKIGRKYTLIVGGLFLFLPWFMIIFTKSLYLLYVGRFLGGMGAGMTVICCAIYIGEIAENDIRGKLGTALTVLKLFGSLMVLCAGPYVSYLTLGIMSLIVPVVYIVLLSFMPETPYYLIKANKKEKAEVNLRLLSSKLTSDKFIRDRLIEVEDCVAEDMRNKTTVWEFLSNPEYRKPIFIMFGIKTLQMLSGEAAIDGYMQTIIEMSESNISAEVSSMIFGFVQLPAVLTSSFLVDKVGRKPLLIISALGCAVALFMEGTFFYFQEYLKVDVTSAGWVPTVGIALFVIMGSLGILSLPYVLLGELFPTNIKGIAVSALTLYGGCLSFVVSKFFKPLGNIWGMYSVFWIFASICTCGAVFVFFALPETKGKTFAEIQAILHGRKNGEDVKN